MAFLYAKRFNYKLLVMYCIQSTISNEERKTSSRFSSNSEANASELLENEEMFSNNE